MKSHTNVVPRFRSELSLSEMNSSRGRVFVYATRPNQRSEQFAEMLQWILKIVASVLGIVGYVETNRLFNRVRHTTCTVVVVTKNYETRFNQ